MSRQEEVIREFVLEQLDELGIDGMDCDINFIPASGRKRNRVILTFPDDTYYEINEILSPYLSELADDFAYTFTGTATYSLCFSDDVACINEDDDEVDDAMADFSEYAALAEPYSDGDVDDPGAQYEEEGLVIATAEDVDNIYGCLEDDDDDR